MQRRLYWNAALSRSFARAQDKADWYQMQLGATSGSLPTCLPGQAGGCATTKSEQAGDLQYVGAGSSGDWLWFGLSTYADWAKVGTGLQPFVDFDTTGDGKPDYETVVRPERPEPRGRPAGELQLG